MIRSVQHGWQMNEMGSWMFNRPLSFQDFDDLKSHCGKTGILMMEEDTYKTTLLRR